MASNQLINSFFTLSPYTIYQLLKVEGAQLPPSRLPLLLQHWSYSFEKSLFTWLELSKFFRNFLNKLETKKHFDMTHGNSLYSLFSGTRGGFSFPRGNAWVGKQLYQMCRSNRYFSPDRIQTIPFVLELRSLLDWVCTDSTLSLFHWLKMEDIYANIYILKCYRTAEKVSRTNFIVFCPRPNRPEIVGETGKVWGERGSSGSTLLD